MKQFARHLDQLERRDFLAGVAKLSLGVSILPEFVGRTRAAAKSPGKGAPATAKNIIFVYMAGGMPHVDTFDPKTVSEVKGQSSPIKTKTPGVQVSNFLPALAKQTDKLAIIRSMSTKTGDHAGGNYLMLELYDTEEDVEAHGETEHLKASGASFRGLMAGAPDIQRLEVIG